MKISRAQIPRALRHLTPFTCGKTALVPVGVLSDPPPPGALPEADYLPLLDAWMRSREGYRDHGWRATPGAVCYLMCYDSTPIAWITQDAVRTVVRHHFGPDAEGIKTLARQHLGAERARDLRHELITAHDLRALGVGEPDGPALVSASCGSHRDRIDDTTLATCQRGYLVCGFAVASTWRLVTRPWPPPDIQPSVEIRWLIEREVRDETGLDALYESPKWQDPEQANAAWEQVVRSRAV